jgi:hypothetical protein
VVTLELRWFVREAVSDSALLAFAEHGEIEDRSDVYQLGLGEEAGLKLRGRLGLLEHKQRLTQIPAQVLLAGPHLDGVIERWHKRWPDPATLPARESGSGPRWARVDKRRAIRTLGGCRAELTALTGPGLASAEYSVAIEVGRADAVDELLAAAVALFGRAPELAAQLADAGESCGYPAWLARRWR